MDKRRTTQEGIDYYAGVMAKAAMDTKETLRDLKEWFPNDEITFKLGYHGIADKPQVFKEHEKGEPDIFVYWKDEIVCGVEVTGSDKISMPAMVWIAKHKMEYAESAEFPIVFALYYIGSRWFLPAAKVRQWAANPQTKTIGGYSEYYHVLDPAHLGKFADLREWVRDQILGHILNRGGSVISQVDGFSKSFAADPSPF